MNKQDLTIQMDTEACYDDLVHTVGIDIETGETFEIKEVQYEGGEEGSTLWLKLSKN